MSTLTDIDSLCNRLRGGEIERQVFVDECARLACSAVGCSRAGLWVFSRAPHERSLRCLGTYDSESKRIVQVEDRLQEDSGPYFDHLRSTGNVVAVDAATHEATRGFYEKGLKPHGIVSLMSVAFSLNGELFGAFTCSQVGSPANWSPRQLAVVSRMGARSALALASVSPNQLDTFFGSP